MANRNGKKVYETNGCGPASSAPDHVQIQTVTGCNARCIFCPNGKTRQPVPMGRRMDDGLYRQIVDQCIEVGVRRYSVYLMNEPMLDRNLPQRITYITTRIKKPQYVKVTSHGGLLTERMARGLLDSGLKKLKISIQSLNPDIYEKIMHLRLGRTLANIDRFLELRQQGGYKRPRLEIVMVDSVHTHHEIPLAQRYWQSRGIRLFIEPVENRADQQDIRNTAVGTKNLQPYAWCRRLMEQIYILYDGRMLQCCADWEQRSVVADLTRERLADIWYGPRYIGLRRRFSEGRIAEMICSNCSKLAPHP